MAALAKVMIVEASSSTFEHEGFSASFLTASRASWRSPPFVVSSLFVVSLEDVRVSVAGGALAHIHDLDEEDRHDGDGQDSRGEYKEIQWLARSRGRLVRLILPKALVDPRPIRCGAHKRSPFLSE